MVQSMDTDEVMERLKVNVILQVIPLLIQVVQVGAPDAQDAAAVLLADYGKQDDENARLFRKLGEPSTS